MGFRRSGRKSRPSPFRRTTCIVIHRWDWTKHPQVVCLRPLPTMKPDWFKHTINATKMRLSPKWRYVEP